MRLMPIVAPYMRRGRRDDGSGRRAQFGLEGERIGLERQQLAIRAEDFKFVGTASTDFGQEDFPDARIAPAAHQAPPPIPAIKVADDRNAQGVGCPDREMRAAHSFVVNDMRAQLVEQPFVRSFREIMVVHRPQHRAIAIGVDQRVIAAVGIPRDISQWLALFHRHLAPEQTIGMNAGQFPDGLALQRQSRDACRVRHHHAGGEALVRRMHAQGGEGIILPTRNQSVDLIPRQHRLSAPLRHAGSFHMSVVYSRIVRSDENQPMRATLWIAFFAQSASSFHRASTDRCAAE